MPLKLTSQDNISPYHPTKSQESPGNNEPEGLKDGRQWTSSEIFAFIGLVNDERNDGALWNTATKFVAPTLKKASEIVTEKFPQRPWRYDTTIRSQFRRIRDDWRIFKEILDTSGTEWREQPNASVFLMSNVLASSRSTTLEQAKLSIAALRRTITLPLTRMRMSIDTYANVFSDEPDAGRMILPATVQVVRGGRNPSNKSEISFGCRRSQDQRLKRTSTDRFGLHRNSDFKSNSKTIAEESLQS
ncbi:hypothetical protein E4U32_007616 [Claviceps aff. humidiphila group G2b]|nr:hypothetical protein E4U32_007616 [Claviceps aff. humidiphila group G2b]